MTNNYSQRSNFSFSGAFNALFCFSLFGISRMAGLTEQSWADICFVLKQTVSNIILISFPLLLLLLLLKRRGLHAALPCRLNSTAVLCPAIAFSDWTRRDHSLFRREGALLESTQIQEIADKKREWMVTGDSEQQSQRAKLLMLQVLWVRLLFIWNWCCCCCTFLFFAEEQNNYSKQQTRCPRT